MQCVIKSSVLCPVVKGSINWEFIVMAKTKKNVLIVGAGPAGLAAGIALLEGGGRENLDVTILNMENVLGGKAKSWEDDQGRYYDYGIHFVFGFYHKLRNLIKRAGIEENDILTSAEGNHYWYEPRDNKVHSLKTSPRYSLSALSGISYSGLTTFEKFNMVQFGMKNLNELLISKKIEHLDDICFTAWAIKGGLDYGLVQTALFRFTQDALFNWPYEISAYVCIKSIRDMFSSYENLLYHLVNGGWTQRIWNPMGDYFEKLGGKVIHRTKLIQLKHDDNRITGLLTARPKEIIPTSGNNNSSPEVSVEEDTREEWKDFDYVISTIPAENFKELNRDDKDLWGQSYFANIHNLTSIAPMGLFVFFKEDLQVPYNVQVNGIDPPLFNAVDLKRIALNYKDNPDFGSVIHMEGQESSFEHLSDKEILDLSLANLAKAEGFEGVARGTVVHWDLQRDNRNHSRYLLTDPGTFKFRPHVKSPYHNLFLAGDWVLNEVAIPSMEGAVTTGAEAANQVLNDIGITGN